MIKATFKNSELTEYELAMYENEPNVLILEFQIDKVRIYKHEFPASMSLLSDFYPNVEISLQAPNIIMTYDNFDVTFEHVHQKLANVEFIEKIKIRNAEMLKLLKDEYIKSGRFALEFFQKVIG